MDLSPENLEAHTITTTATRARLEEVTAAALTLIDNMTSMKPPPHVAEQLEAARIAVQRMRHSGGVFLASRLNVLKTAQKAVTP